MKKTISALCVFLLAGVVTLNAQGGGGGFQRPPIPERVKLVLEKLEPFKLDEAKKIQVDSAFTQAYRAQDAKRDEMRAAGNQDRDAMRAEMQKINTERDDKLKKIFTEEQYKEWKEKIEPSLRPQRQGGGGNN